MAMTRTSLLLALAAAGADATSSTSTLSVRANPIRKVVTMLQNIQKKVEQEGEAEEELFKKFMCYCKNGAGDLAKSIDTLEAKLSDVAASLKSSEGQAEQLKADLKAHKSDRATAKTAIAEATKLREKEAAAFASDKAESETNIDAITKAVAALEKGSGAAFLQSSAAANLKALVQSKDDLQSRDEIVAFLQDGDSSEGSGEIIGILKQLGDEMSADLADATKTENDKIAGFDELVAAKKKEISALTQAIEEKMTRVGEIEVSIAEMKGESGDAVDDLAADKKFLADLDKNCETKKAEWDDIVKARSEELLALADTIKMLNDDDALDLFKKTLPSASSFMQVQMTETATRQRALDAIHEIQRKSNHPSHRLDFISLALHGKKVGFEKVIAMVDEMMGVLKTEQAEDTKKKEYCEAEFDKADDEKKELERGVSDAQTAIDDAKETVATLADEIKAVSQGIKDLDKQVAEATEQRKEENAAYKELMASNGAAKELIGMAKNRLNKFYNPKLYKAPPKRELTEEERIAVNMGETLAPTPAPGGIAGTGITALAQVSEHADPGPAPEAPGPFKKKSEESNGVIAMMDLLVKDLDKEMTVAETEEKDAQADYESMTADAAKKRADDSKLLEDKESARADAQASLQTEKDNKASTSKKLMGVNEYIASLHADCDFVLKYFDVRKEARTDELDALDKAKAVLNGADYSFLQTEQTVKRALRGVQQHL